MRLSRTRDDLIVSLLDAGGAVTDSLTVSWIEGVLFEDGSRRGAADFAVVALISGQGMAGVDIYDSGLDDVVSLAQGVKGLMFTCRVAPAAMMWCGKRIITVRAAARIRMWFG